MSESVLVYKGKEIAAYVDKHCQGRIIGTGGGGYNRHNVARAWSRVVQSFVEAP